MATTTTTSALFLSTLKPPRQNPFFQPKQQARVIATQFTARSLGNERRVLRALQKNKEDASAEEITKKYGLEFGLWKIFSSEDKGDETVGGKEKSKTDQAKELLAKYGGAYLATSITLSIISFTLCYLLVNAGIDVQALLNQVGIATDETGGKVGTFALAYAAHKAASPIRFPPTVALTPIVANWIGKKREENK